jgi:hypothetical protein
MKPRSLSIGSLKIKDDSLNLINRNEILQKDKAQLQGASSKTSLPQDKKWFAIQDIGNYDGI